jgi:hypothetical protein
MYQEIFNKLDGVKADMVKRLADNAFIPFSLENTDYQEYLKWVAEGNLPSPADIVEPSQASVTPLPADE